MYSVTLHVVFASEDVVSIHRLNVVFDDPLLVYSAFFLTGTTISGDTCLLTYIILIAPTEYPKLTLIRHDEIRPMGLGMRLMLVL